MMPSSAFSLHRNRQSNHSFASDHDSKSDDDDDDGYYKKGTMRNDMLERPSDDDDDDSRSQSDVTDNDEHDNKKANDLLTSASNPLTHYLNRQVTLYENDWPKKSSAHERQSRRTIAYEARATSPPPPPSKSDPSSYFDSRRHRMVSGIEPSLRQMSNPSLAIEFILSHQRFEGHYHSFDTYVR